MSSNMTWPPSDDPGDDELAVRRLPWYRRIFLRLFPHAFFRRQAQHLKADGTLYRRAHEALAKVERVDLFPSASGQRGFLLVLDRTTALYFYQDGDHFVYDGFEIGEYEPGDVTVLDGVRSK